MRRGVRLNIILDKLLDEMVGLIFSKSSEEILEIINTNTRQKLLADTIKKFVESQYYNIEYSRLKYVGNCEPIMTITNDELSVTLTEKDLLIQNAEKIKRCFVEPDTDFNWTPLLNNIICQYMKRATLNTTLGEVLISEKANTEKLLSELADVKNYFLSEDKLRENEKKRNEQIYRTFLKDKVNNYISKLSQVYIIYVTKQPVSYKGCPSDYLMYIQEVQQIKDIIKNINDLVKLDFFKRPVDNIIGPKPDSLKANHKIIECYEFAETYFRGNVMGYFNELMMYRTFLDISFFSLTMEINMIIDSNVSFKAFSSPAYNHMKESTFTNIKPEQAYLAMLGNTILKFERFYIK